MQAYYLKKIAEADLHAVEERAKRVHPDYCRSLHEVDKKAGTKCAAPRLADGKCSYGVKNGWEDSRHSKGGGERYLVSEFGTVQPLVFGHFGETNKRFQTLIDELAEVVANLRRASVRAEARGTPCAVLGGRGRHGRVPRWHPQRPWLR